MTINVFESAQRLINVVCGEPYGDGFTVTDIGQGYAEPGYGSRINDDAIWVLGNWNDKGNDTMPSRLQAALERIGVECEWLDEWTQCTNCYRIVRTQPDSYSWQPSYEISEDSEPTCSDCLITMGMDALTDYVNDAHRLLQWAPASHLTDLGFTLFDANDGHQYENGWHPGQTDDPTSVLTAIQSQFPDTDDAKLEVIFVQSEQSQFYIGFEAYYRMTTDDVQSAWLDDCGLDD